MLACLAAMLFILHAAVFYYCCLDAGIGGCDSLKDSILITCFEMHVSVEESALGSVCFKTQTYSRRLALNCSSARYCFSSFPAFIRHVMLRIQQNRV